MIRLSLHPHATTLTAAVRGLTATLKRGVDGALRVEFVIDAHPGSVVVPASDAGGFRDGLWRHTCFELFAAGEGAAYREFNFAPSTHYAIYDFDGYRTGMRAVAAPCPPSIEATRSGLSIAIRIPAELMPRGRQSPGRIGVAAVVEERGRVLTYWAAHHPAQKPDFHDSAGFVVSLTPGIAVEDR